MGNIFEKCYLDYSDSDAIRKAIERSGSNISNGYTDAVKKAKEALNGVFGAGIDYSTMLRDYTPSYPAAHRIKNVIFNPPATIVFWADNTKTVVRCGPYDNYDPEKGLAMAFCKKVMGNHGNYYNELRKWLPKEPEAEDDKPLTSIFMNDAQTFTLNLDPSCVRIEDGFGNLLDLVTGRRIMKDDIYGDPIDLSSDKFVE